MKTETGISSVGSKTFSPSLNRFIGRLRDKLARVAVNPDYELKLIVEYLMGVDLWHLYFIGDEGHNASTSKLKLVEKAVELRVKTRLPIQYILGRAPFFGMDFRIDENVLIPRPETELMVEKALELIPDDRQSKCLDVGTGSGCIAISILKNTVHLRCVATDISSKALKVAKINARLHGVEERLNFVQSDVMSGVKGKFDLIISNPPYVTSSELEGLPAEVKFEPIIALDGGEDGLKVIKKLVRQAASHLKDGGYLLFEISPMIKDRVAQLMENLNWNFSIEHDLSGLARYVVAKKQG